MSDKNERMRVPVEGGKYAVVQLESGKLIIEREGAPWIVEPPGSKMLIALACEVEELRTAKVDSLKSAEEMRKSIDYLNDQLQQALAPHITTENLKLAIESVLLGGPLPRLDVETIEWLQRLTQWVSAAAAADNNSLAAKTQDFVETNIIKPDDKWTTLQALPVGAVFETLTGTRAVKSEYHYSDEYPAIQCVLLASGEYAHFSPHGSTGFERAERHNNTIVREIAVVTRKEG